jgi:hypothetical protein
MDVKVGFPTTTYIDHLKILVMEDTIISDASETSSAFHQHMNRGHNIFCPEERQEEDDVHSKISDPLAENGGEDKSSAISAINNFVPATKPPSGVEEDLPPESTPILTTLPSNSDGSRKQGVATTARETSPSKKKKAAAQCRKGARVKVTRSMSLSIMHRERHLKATKKVITSSGKFYLGVESKDTIAEQNLFVGSNHCCSVTIV